MSTVWEVVEPDRDYTVSISDAARQKLAEEQRNDRVSQIQIDIKLGAAIGAVFVIGALSIIHASGAMWANS